MSTSSNSVGMRWVAGVGGTALVVGCGMWIMSVANAATSAKDEINELKTKAAVAENDKKHIEETLDMHTQWLKSISQDVRNISQKIDEQRKK